MSNEDVVPEEKPSGWMPNTRWTWILKVQTEKEDPTPSNALESLCKAYWAPIETAFRAKHGFSPEDAEDAAQEFLVWFLDKKLFFKADQTVGRFRNYLLTCLDNFARNWRRKKGAEKSGGKAIHQPIHPDSNAGTPGIDIASGEDPEHQIRLAWARSTLNAARTALKQGEFEENRGDEWKVLKEFLSVKTEVAHEEAANTLGISIGTLNGKIFRLRKRLYTHLRRQVSTTVSTEDEFQEEMEFLRDVYS